MLTLTWSYAVSHQLVRGEMTRAQTRHIVARQLVTPAVFLLSAGVEFMAPHLNIGPVTLVIIPLGLWAEERWLGQVAANRPAGPTTRAEVLWRAGTLLPWMLVIGLAIWAMTL